MKWTVPAFSIAFGLAIMLPVTGYAPSGGALFAVAGAVELLASRAWAQSEHHRFLPGEPSLSVEQAVRLLRGLHVVMGFGFIMAGAMFWRYGAVWATK